MTLAEGIFFEPTQGLASHDRAEGWLIAQAALYRKGDSAKLDQQKTGLANGLPGLGAAESVESSCPGDRKVLAHFRETRILGGCPML